MGADYCYILQRHASLLIRQYPFPSTCRSTRNGSYEVSHVASLPMPTHTHAHIYINSMLNTSSTFVPLIYLLRRDFREREEDDVDHVDWRRVKMEGERRKREMPWHVYRRHHSLKNDYIIPLSVVSSTWTRFQSTDECTQGWVVCVRLHICVKYTHACDSKVAWCNKGGPRDVLWEIQQRDTVISKRAVLQTGVITTGLLDLHSRN